MVETVIIAGAGIGDKKNLTIAVKEALDRADVIIYDRLLNQEIIEEYFDNKEMYYVGKAAANHALPQEQINELIVERAKTGKKVVRLKGGDPYVFGRGGEEALFLKEHGIPFVVLPGLTAGVVALNTAGIPATFRDLSTSISFITGHLAEDKEPTFDKYAQLDGTLVFYMGLNNLPTIVDGLFSGGMAEDTKIALISRGGYNTQITHTSTLGDILEEYEALNFPSPTLIVIGDVVSLREELNYFEARPLFGKHIVITRPPHQRSKLQEDLHALGAVVHSLPTIEIQPIHEEVLDSDVENFSYDYLVFTSVNSVEIFFSHYFKKHDVRDLAGTKIAVIGKKTKALVEKYHLKADIYPDVFVGEELIEAMRETIQGPATIYFPHSKITRPELITVMQELGDVRELAVYDTVKPRDRKPLPATMDAILFTSSSTVDNFIELYGKEALEKVNIYSIGRITSQRIEDHGLSLRKESDEATIDSLIKTVEEDLR